MFSGANIYELQNKNITIDEPETRHRDEFENLENHTLKNNHGVAYGFDFERTHFGKGSKHAVQNQKPKKQIQNEHGSLTKSQYQRHFLDGVCS